MSSGRSDSPTTPSREKREWVGSLRKELGLSPAPPSDLDLDIDLDLGDDLDTLDLGLDSTIPTAPSMPDSSPTVSTGSVPKVRGPTGTFVKLQAARLEWRTAAARVERALRETADGLVEEFDDKEAADSIIEKMDDHFEDLHDALDTLLETPSNDPAHAEARRAVLDVLTAYSEDVKSDPVLKVLDRSPYTSVKVGQTLSQSLAAVRKNLS